MGLSPYGKPTLIQLRDVLFFKDNGLFEINKKYFKHPKDGVQMSWEKGEPDIENLYSDYLVEKFGKPRSKGEELTEYHKNLAASVQKITEELIFHILNHLQKEQGLQIFVLQAGLPKIL